MKRFMLNLQILTALTLLVLPFQNCAPYRAKVMQENDQSSVQSRASFQCDSNAAPSENTQRRLNKVEYRNTLVALLKGLSAADVSAITASLTEPLSSIPEDIGVKFDRSDSQISQPHVVGYLYVAQSYAKLLTTSLPRAQAFFGACATQTNMDDTCLTRFLTDKAARIYRRPLTSAEVATLKADYASYSVDDRNYWLLTRMLMSVNFLLHLENKGSLIAVEVYAISPYELANRLSYYLLQTMPDQELYAAAADGTLQTEIGFQRQLVRLTSGTFAPKIQSLAGEFYSAWLGFDQVPYPGANPTAAYMAMAAGESLSRESMVREIKNLTDYYTFQTSGTVDDLLTSDISFAQDRDLAGIYKVAPWNGDPTNLIKFPKGERTGLLTRAAFLATPSAQTNPVMRGVTIRRNILCDEIPPPPDSVMQQLRTPDLDRSMTTRERYAAKTGSAFCMSCHSQINPVGFALEGFDSLGRYRTTEKIFDSDGTLLNSLSVNTSVQPNITTADSTNSSDAEHFNILVAESGKVQACMVKQYFQFTFAREPDLAADGCTLQNMLDDVAGPSGSLKKLFTNAPQSKNFRLRHVH